MLKIVSTTWPWDHGYFSVEKVITNMKTLGANEVCIRTPAYYLHYDDVNDPTFHDRLAIEARAQGMSVSLWCPISLVYPSNQAASIHVEYDRYKPSRIILDAERTWVNLYGGNTGPFLEALGRMPCPIGLSSYRRPSLHTQIRWQTWLKAKAGGDFIIDFQASQLYPIGWLSPSGWTYQFRLDIDDNEYQHELAGRPDIPWLPFMPAFREGLDPYNNTWYPRVDGVDAAMKYMVNRLGSRLVGVNWWSLDQDLAIEPTLKPLYQYISGTTPPFGEYSAWVTASTLNVRVGPGIEYAKVSPYLVYGDIVTVYKEQNGWGQIGEGRWISLAWITQTMPTTSSYSAKVMADVLNVRSGPGTNFPKVGQKNYGDLVAVYEERPGTSSVAGWGRISTDRWVSLDWLIKV